MVFVELNTVSAVGVGVTSLLAYLLFVIVRRVISWYKLRATLLRDWPGLPAHWLWGNVKQHPVSDPSVRAGGFEEGLAFWRDLTAKYPHGFRWFAGPLGLGVVGNNPDMFRAVMKGKDPKPLMPLMPNYRFLLPWLGYGLLLAAGDRWFRNRRLLTPAFHFNVLKTYINVYNQATDILLSKMSEHASSGKSFQVTKHVSLCTLDILLQCAFSYKADIQVTGDSHQYVTSISNVTVAFQERAFSPHLYLDFIFERSAVGKKFKESVDYMHKISDSLIKQRREEMSQGKATSGSDGQLLDFLGILIEARDEDGKGLTAPEIRNEVDTFLFEGHDTTASGLTWMLYVMAKYPEHQKRVQEEIDGILEGRDSDEIKWEDLGKFPYMMQCLKETMRLYPPVPLIQRVIADNDIVINGRLIPKGTLVELNIYALHHNPEVWSNPSEFNPDRFSPENAKKIDPFAFVPFSAGPRNCIGQNFALNEEKVVLTRVLRKFHIELDPDHKVITSLQLVQKALNDVKIKLTPRF